MNTKCTTCGQKAVYACADCNDQVFCSDECHIGVGIRDPLLREPNAYVTVRVTDMSREWKYFRGAWLNAHIVRAPLPGEPGVLVEFERTDIGPQQRIVAHDRIERFRDFTENHRYKLGDRVHVRKQDPNGEVWWEARVVFIGHPDNQGPEDTVVVKYEYQYENEDDQIEPIRFKFVRLANMADFEHM